MSGNIDPALLERIRERLRCDWRRTGEGAYDRMPKEARKSLPSGGLAQTVFDLAFGAYEPPAPGPIKPIEPMSAKAVEKVETSIGVKLPPQLRQLYLEIGDGNFGPYNGIRRLSNWAKDYSKLRADMLAERGREWPETLLPIVYLNGKRICVDAHTGEVILWTKPPKKTSEKKWLASFVPQSPTVEAWLERWVDTPTSLEGGPNGGWSPPDEELERRAAVERDKEAKREAELEKARTVAIRDFAPLDDELVDRVRARAMDPQRRTYFAGVAAKSTPIGLDDIEDELARNAHNIPGHAVAGLAGLIKGLRKIAPLIGLPQLNMVTDGPGHGMMMVKAGAGGKLGAPATEAALAHADAKLGFALPEPLRQLYRIADGGFGPGDGLLSLARTIALYAKLTSKPQGPGGEPWPAKLLPIWEVDEEIGALDLESGGITTYDPSRMQDIHGGYWRRSFAKEHGSIAEMLEKWLGSTTYADKQARQAERERRMEQEAAEAGDDIYVRRALDFYGSISPEQRAAHGLPEVGWEEVVRRRHGSG